MALRGIQELKSLTSEAQDGLLVVCVMRWGTGVPLRPTGESTLPASLNAQPSFIVSPHCPSPTSLKR